MSWALFGIAALLCLSPFLFTLWRPAAPRGRREADLALYQAQRAELDGQLAEGRLDQGSHATALLELQRRILAAPAEAMLRQGSGQPVLWAALFLIPVGICVLCYLMLRYTMLGRSIYAIGGDQRAAHVAGFNVRGTQFFVYMLSGGIAGLGGITYMTLMRQADPSVRMGREMMVIAAVVMGGTRITGGHGKVIGTVLGVALITLIKNNLIMLGVPAHFQTFVVGMVIVVGTSITSLRAKSSANRAKV